MNGLKSKKSYGTSGISFNTNTTKLPIKCDTTELTSKKKTPEYVVKLKEFEFFIIEEYANLSPYERELYRPPNISNSSKSIPIPPRKPIVGWFGYKVMPVISSDTSSSLSGNSSKLSETSSFDFSVHS